MEEESETLYWCPAQTRADRWHAVQLLLLHWRGGLGELILKVYFIEFSSLWKTSGTQHPIGHEEEIGTNNFCLVELDLLMRISIMERMIDFIHSFSPVFASPIMRFICAFDSKTINKLLLR